MTLQWYERVTSTQDHAHTLAAAGAPHGTAIAATMQLAGRGTRGRDWRSAEGGLWLSVVCRPIGSAALEAVGLRVGLGLAEYLDGLIRPPARIALKWPNDLLLGAEKLGGILAEARWQGDQLGWITVGVGINVRNAVPWGTVPRAARLADAGVAESPRELAYPVASAVAAAAKHAAPLSAEELEEFARRDWLKGRRLETPEPGIAEGISAAGLLRVRRPDGTLAEVFGSVALAERP